MLKSLLLVSLISWSRTENEDILAREKRQINFGGGGGSSRPSSSSFGGNNRPSSGSSNGFSFNNNDRPSTSSGNGFSFNNNNNNDRPSTGSNSGPSSVEFDLSSGNSLSSNIKSLASLLGDKAPRPSLTRRRPGVRRRGSACSTPRGEAGTCQYIFASQCGDILAAILQQGITQQVLAYLFQVRDSTFIRHASQLSLTDTHTFRPSEVPAALKDLTSRSAAPIPTNRLCPRHRHQQLQPQPHLRHQGSAASVGQTGNT